jgi:hypothetical protein
LKLKKNLLFLKKKKQKDFFPVLGVAVPQALPTGKKFFGSFLQKRTFFLTFP